MKKKIFLALVLVLTLMLALVGCRGQKAVSRLEIIDGLKTEYELNEVPDYTNVRVRAIYNDGDVKEVNASDLSITVPDTSISGETKITITYQGVSLDVTVTVKGQAVEETAYLTGIQYQSGLVTEMFTTTNEIDTLALKVLATYSDGTKGLIDNSKLSTNISELDFSTPGVKTVVIKYQKFSCEFNITVKAPEIVSIEVDKNSINTVVQEGETLDVSTIKVYVIYNNGNRTLLSTSDPKLDLVSGMPDLSQDGSKEYTITYDGKFSCTLIISATPAVLTGITLNTNNAVSSILLGDTLSTAAVTATASYSNNTSETIANSNLQFNYDVSKVGDATVTVSYTYEGVTMSASYTVKVLGISKVEIDADSIAIKLPVDTELDLSKLTILVTDTEGGIHEISDKTEFSVNSANLNTTVLGKGYITVTYRGVTSDNFYITVYDQNVSYIITGVELPESLTKWNSSAEGNMKSHFTKHDSPYVVGDDNPFVLTLTIIAYNADTAEKVDVKTYTSVSEVYLNGAKLTGADLDKYVTINESKNSFDFTEEAIGKTFTIKTRPAHGVDGYEETYSRSMTVTIVDGYNIYQAYELNFITNWSDFEFNAAKVDPSETRTQVEIVRDFIENEKKVAMPTIGSAIVLHNDLYIMPTDIPKEYFVGKNRGGELYDYLNVFSHMTTAEYPSFTLYGNYFTVCSNTLPVVCAEGTGNQDEGISNSQLFGFSVNPDIKWGEGIAFDHTRFTTTLKDVRIRDDHPNTNDNTTSGRDMRGLIGIKTWLQIVNFENTRFDRFFISYLADSDYQTVNINDSIFYNSWQNHLFIWSDNPFYGESDNTDFEHANYPALTVNINNTSVTKCGGPVIISQVKQPELNPNKYSGAHVNYNNVKSDLWTYVDGTEAWFGAMGAGPVADIIKNFNTLLYSIGGGSYVHESPIPELTDGSFMNIIYVNLEAGFDLNATTNAFTDLDGTFSVNDKVIADLTDGTHGGGYTDNLISVVKGFAANAPVFVSSEGGIAIAYSTTEMTPYVYNFLANMIASSYNIPTDMAAQQVCQMLGIAVPTGYTAGDYLNYLDYVNASKVGYGQYITIYHNNMSIVLEYNIKAPERYTAPAI